jgi:ABC-type Mn2+/Zn2+ transport system ATPase subunit
MIVGPVGGGKSTLLHAAPGDVSLTSGTLHVPATGSTAYCAQDAWLRAESIRSAIVFVSPYDPAWYAHVLRALALDRDLAGLKDGDGTPTGHLSGGQRQRVALARAVYSHAERYVLDDVFSALDANTEEAVWGMLYSIRSEG